MDIENLIESLQNAAGGPEGIKMCHAAATALSTLQTENKKLRAELENYRKGHREEAISTLTPPNEPLAQADLDSMDYDKVWIDYGDDGEWALVVSGRIYALAVLEGTGFEDILRDEVGGETMDRPTGDYTVYRRSPKAKDNNVPPNEPLTLEELREMDEPVWVTCKPIEGGNGYWCLCQHGHIITPAGSIYDVKEIPHWVFYRRPLEGAEDGNV
ncbi:hypothetical protein [Dysosmobacter welbionis]|uniref:hypothetical protein n=1 Tax=Dysosmobacter welbionis TaxID=2093857 RepID=UPI002E784EBC|nr:hypothetical protein [Dysosmobacter welbionis]